MGVFRLHRACRVRHNGARHGQHEHSQGIDADEPFRCFVDSADPAAAVLYRQLRWGMLGFELLFALLFPLVGAVLLTWALRATLQWRRFGSSQFEMQSNPGVLGGSLQGRIHTRLPVIVAAGGVTVTLRCIRRVTTGSGRNRSSHDRVLWQDSYRVPAGALVAGLHGASVPVRFAIPYEAGPASAPEADEPVRWQLAADGKLPGVDYEARFTVPVYRTPQSRPGVEIGSLDQAVNAAGRPSSDLEVAGIVRAPAADGGTTYVFPRGRARGPVLGMSVFLLLWCGVIWLMNDRGAPILFPIGFGLSALLLLLLLAQMALRETRVRIGSGALTFSRRWLASGKEFAFTAADIASIRAGRGLQAGNKLYYRIVLETRAGKRYTLASLLQSQRLAQSLIRDFETALAS